MKINRPIILASKSPRRSQLLKACGFEFEVKTMDVEESYPADLKTSEVAAYLARKKAQGSKSLITDNEILITADTIVTLGETVYGKPKDYADACHILRQLSGQVHEVITGICLTSKDKEVVLSDTAKVYLKPLTDEEIDYYVKTYEPYDKAGAYAIQEWIGLTKIEKIEGSYFTIMGLPTHLIYEGLLAF